MEKFGLNQLREMFLSFFESKRTSAPAKLFTYPAE